MKTAPFVTTLLVGASLAACGGSQQAHTTTNTQTAIVSSARPAEPPPDTSEVPRPSDVVAVVRVSSINQIVDRMVQLSGMGEAVRSQANESLSQIENGLGAAIDENAPVDVVVAMSGHDDVDAVIGFGAASMDDIERTLANTHRLTLVGNGVRRIEREHAAISDNGTDRDTGASRQQCVAAPTADPHHTRIVCSSNASLLEALTPYEARTLSRTPVASDTINADILLEPIREHFAHDHVERIEHERQRFDNEIQQSTDIVDPAVRQAITTLAHDVFDALHAVITDPTVFNVSLAFTNDRVALHFGLDMRGPEGNLLRALFEAFRNQPPPSADIVSHLLPGGWLYATGSADSRPLRPTIQELVEIGNQLALHHRGFNNADRNALHAALEGFNLVDQSSSALAVGNDDAGHLWFVATFHNATTTPAQFIGSSRATVAALRRPHIAAVIRALFTHANVPATEWGDLRDVPTRGLPAGSYAFRLPPLDRLTQSQTTSAHGAPATHPSAGHAAHGAGPAQPPLQVLLVPDGQNVQMVMAPDARAVYTRFHENTTPGIAIEATAPGGAAMTMAFVAAGMPNLLRASSEHDAQQMAQALSHLPDQGRTPITLRFGTANIENGVRTSLDVDVAATTVRNYIALITRGGAVAAPAATP